MALWPLLCSLLLLVLPLPPRWAAAAASCPLDLSYVSTFPWDRTPCVQPIANMSSCCITLRGVIAIGIAQRLHDTGLFRLPDANTSDACVLEFQSEISAAPISLSSDLVASCFSPGEFAISADYCAGIFTTADWTAKLGNSTELNAACSGDLSNSALCDGCVKAGFNVSSTLVAIDGNSSTALPCFYQVILYAAGIVNQFGPKDPRTAKCTFGLALSAPSSSGGNSHAAVYGGVFGALAAVLACCAVGLFVWRVSVRKRMRGNSALSGRSSHSYPRPNTGSIWFDIKELRKATGGFSHSNFVGRGGFGIVYKGTLADGSVVAVKKVLEQEIEGGDEEFRNEVEIISQLRHRNLVPLRGCCITDDVGDAGEGKQRFLVYDYMPNRSLNDHIFGDGSSAGTLTWPQRKTIILDIAKGLVYLHYGMKPAIFHRDIKATNILLDGEMRARVADFGLARQSREGQSHLTTRVAGTHGYLAPEYALYGQLTEKSDVYSFGILLLEIMSGRRALDMRAASNLVLITDWAWTLIKAGRTEEVLDGALTSNDDGRPYPKGIMERFVMVGILCSHVMVALRPTIMDALKMLEGDIDVPEIPDRPLPFSHGLVYGDGNTFAASPALSGPSLNAGDMLR